MARFLPARPLFVSVAYREHVEVVCHQRWQRSRCSRHGKCQGCAQVNVDHWLEFGVIPKQLDETLRYPVNGEGW